MNRYDSEQNKLLITPFDCALGEILLYDGSLRVAITKELWEDKKFQKQIKIYITKKIQLQNNSEVNKA